MIECFRRKKGKSKKVQHLFAACAVGAAVLSAKANAFAIDAELLPIVQEYSETQVNISDIENELRQLPVEYIRRYLGCSNGSAGHKAIIKAYNDSKLCKRYKMSVSDPWCAATVSAAFIETGLADILPCVECYCEYMIDLADDAGIWVEDDAYVPETGDIIMYDWSDSGYGDCTGHPDHVGVVCTVDDGMISVIEGNRHGTVAYRDVYVDGMCIRGYITPDYRSEAVMIANEIKAQKNKEESSDTAIIASTLGNISVNVSSYYY